ncbi:MAG: chemotaxis response regulator protein-glutamate methylesterase [Myxococcota bacterium]
MSRIRVLVVDGSPQVRRTLARGLDAHPGIEVVSTAGDAYEARDKIVRCSPDVVTLAIDLPRMDGITFLEKLMPQYPLPVVVVATAERYGGRTTSAARTAGAVSFVEKPPTMEGPRLDAMLTRLRGRIEEASRVRFERPTKRPVPPPSPSSGIQTAGKLIAIGSSTGGVEALQTVLTSLPGTVPAILVVQHMPDTFTGPFSRRLNQLCAFAVKEAQHGDLIRPGQCFLAPGDRQLRLLKEDGRVRVVLSSGPKVDGHRPSATVMMTSVAKTFGPNASGAILTGMGRDGADGLLAMRRAGAHTVVQDEDSSVVYGMPKAAWECGAARYRLPLHHVAESLLRPFRT